MTDELVIIDGNNLLHAMHAHAPLPAVGREKLVRLTTEWASRSRRQATLVFDGPIPREGLAEQMTSGPIAVRFSGPQTADDVIVEMIHGTKNPAKVRIVSSDTAIRREARYRRCRHTDSADFVAELCAAGTKRKEASRQPRRNPDEKPDEVAPEERGEWLKAFGYEDVDDESYDGQDAMEC